MKQTTKNILGVGAIVLLSSGVAGLTTYKLLQSNDAAKETSFNEMFQQNPNVKLAAFDAVNAQPVDLTQAAENSLHAVVHIKSTQEAKTRTVQQAPDIFDFFFGDGRGQQRQVQSQPRVGFGSGVIISKDGYIVTNNHVIEGADEISVKLNDNREFRGRVIGTDPSTDLALVKIEGDDFPTIPVGDSEALKVGEWVLAVGNPFNLNSTVTAGIVSAKARTLGVYNGGIESLSDIRQILIRFPLLKGVFIGRGLLSSPLLAKEFKGNETFLPEQRMSIYFAFHEELFSAYSQVLQGETQLLVKMKTLWEYFLPETDRKLLKRIKKSTRLQQYTESVKAIFTS